MPPLLQLCEPSEIRKDVKAQVQARTMPESVPDSSRPPPRRTWSTKQLACLSCKRKKVKVGSIRPSSPLLVPGIQGTTYHHSSGGMISMLRQSQCQPNPQGSGACGLCAKLNEECYVPEFDERRRTHAKEIIERLREENARLRAELEEHRAFCYMDQPPGLVGPGSSVGTSSSPPARSASLHEYPHASALPPPPSAPPADAAGEDVDLEVSPSTSAKSDNMIVRLCGGQRQLNSDRIGRLRYFGPTSSLHLMESVTSTLLTRELSGAHHPSWQDDFPLPVQDYLLDLYWRFHHTVLPWYVLSFPQYAVLALSC